MQATEPPNFDDVYAVSPPDGAVVGARPVFLIGFDGVAARDVRRMRFRIALSRDGFASESHAFDQRRRRSGWVAAEDDRFLFRPPRPLEDGRYDWRVWAWNGVEWIAGGPPRSLRVDTVPPAAVRGVELRYERETKRLVVVWDPVTEDLHGATEYVARYHVFRFERTPDLPTVRPFEIGVVEIPRFVDEAPDAPTSILYYKVVAEDEAGNMQGRRD